SASPPGGPGGSRVPPTCPTCHGALTARLACWACCDRLCSRCGRPTGSAFIETGWPCWYHAPGGRGGGGRGEADEAGPVGARGGSEQGSVRGRTPLRGATEGGSLAGAGGRQPWPPWAGAFTVPTLGRCRDLFQTKGRSLDGRPPSWPGERLPPVRVCRRPPPA